MKIINENHYVKPEIEEIDLTLSASVLDGSGFVFGEQPDNEEDC